MGLFNSWLMLMTPVRCTDHAAFPAPPLNLLAAGEILVTIGCRCMGREVPRRDVRVLTVLLRPDGRVADKP